MEIIKTLLFKLNGDGKFGTIDNHFSVFLMKIFFTICVIQNYEKIYLSKFEMHRFWRLTNTFIIPNGLQHFYVQKSNTQNKTQKLNDELHTKYSQTILGCVSRWFYVVHWTDSSRSICFYSESPQLYTNSTNAEREFRRV